MAHGRGARAGEVPQVQRGALATAGAGWSENAPQAYAGVVPGKGGAASRTSASDVDGAVLLTWPGFQLGADGSSRVFVQTSAPVEFDSEAQPRRFVLRLKGIKVPLSNNRRPLETKFFATPVTRVRLARRGRDTLVILELREAATPQVYARQEGDGQSYVYVDFRGKSGPSSNGERSTATGDAPPSRKNAAANAVPREATRPSVGIENLPAADALPPDSGAEPLSSAVTEDDPPPIMR